MQDKHALRKSIRKQRALLTSSEQTVAARNFRRHLQRYPRFHTARRIAAYLPMRGEADPQLIIEAAWELGKEVFLPCLHGNRLAFSAYRPDTRLAKNQLGIAEPQGSLTLASPRQLDLVIAPLVAYDANGNRLGMGGGFYDRTFSFLRHQHDQGHRWQKPHLLGLAHAFQQHDDLPREPWDVPLSAVLTEQGILHIS